MKRGDKGFFGKVRLDANYFRRLVNNTPYDDQIENTRLVFRSHSGRL